MKIVPQRVSESQARAWFRRRGFGLLGWLLGLLTPGKTLKDRTLPRLELIWMPHYLYSVEVCLPRKPSGTMGITVDAWGGVFMVVEMTGDLDEGDPQEAVFQPMMTPEQAESVGREQLVRALMRRRGQRDKPTPGNTVSHELFYYPFWVYYYQRMPGAIDIGLLDAASGDKTGPRMKRAVLKAFHQAGSEGLKEDGDPGC
jgi:hypothetical protein